MQVSLVHLAKLIESAEDFALVDTNSITLDRNRHQLYITFRDGLFVEPFESKPRPRDYGISLRIDRLDELTARDVVRLLAQTGLKVFEDRFGRAASWVIRLPFDPNTICNQFKHARHHVITYRGSAFVVGTCDADKGNKVGFNFSRFGLLSVADIGLIKCTEVNGRSYGNVRHFEAVEITANGPPMLYDGRKITQQLFIEEGLTLEPRS